MCNALQGGEELLVAMRFSTGLLASAERPPTGRPSANQTIQPNAAQRRTAEAQRQLPAPPCRRHCCDVGWAARCLRPQSASLPPRRRLPPPPHQVQTVL